MADREPSPEALAAAREALRGAGVHITTTEFIEQMALAIDCAVTTERERCAGIVDAESFFDIGALDRIAALIRSGEQP